MWERHLISRVSGEAPHGGVGDGEERGVVRESGHGADDHRHAAQL